MAARGTQAKEEIIKKIMETFDGAFKYQKEIRVPMIENGEEVQIKITLTAAKENVAVGGDTALPGEVPSNYVPNDPARTDLPFEAEGSYMVQPTEEEKQNVVNLLKSIGL